MKGKLTKLNVCKNTLHTFSKHYFMHLHKNTDANDRLTDNEL